MTFVSLFIICDSVNTNYLYKYLT